MQKSVNNVSAEENVSLAIVAAALEQEKTKQFPTKATNPRLTLDPFIQCAKTSQGYDELRQQRAAPQVMTSAELYLILSRILPAQRGSS